MGTYGITDSEYTQWLASDGIRCLLANLTAYSGVVVESRYLSTMPFITRPIDTPANQEYTDTILEVPLFSSQLSELFMGRSLPGWGDLIIINPNGMFDAWLNDGWDGRVMTLRHGHPLWKLPDFRVIFSGVVADIDAPSRDTIAIRMRDKTHLFDKPIQTNLVGGTTTNKDQPVPLCFGQCFNVEPVLTVAASHTYQVHDGAIEAITEVRDNGVSVTYSANLATGTFTLSGAPVGRVTADVKGAKPSTYLTTAADIIQHLVITYGGLSLYDLDTASFTSLNSKASQTLGLYIRDRRNLIDVIDDLITSVGGFWTFTRTGLMRLGRLEAPSGTAAVEFIADDIEADSITMSSRDIPVASIRLGYAKNWTVQDADGLAGAVSETNRTLFSSPISVAKATNSVTTKHLLAANPDVIDTLIVSSADAVAEATRRAALRSVVRSRVRLTTFSKALALNLGDTVDLTHPRFGYSSGELAIVVGLRDQVSAGRVELELWR